LFNQESHSEQESIFEAQEWSRNGQIRLITSLLHTSDLEVAVSVRSLIPPPSSRGQRLILLKLTPYPGMTPDYTKFIDS